MSKNVRATADVAQDRLEHVLELMARGQWIRRITAKKLSSEWGISVRAVQDYATKASRILWSGDIEDVQELRAETISKLGVIATKAEVRGELRSAVAALTERSVVAGLTKPTGEVAVSVLLGHPATQEMMAFIGQVLVAIQAELPPDAPNIMARFQQAVAEHKQQVGGARRLGQ